MPRRPRVEFAGAVYHVMDRGNRLETIFLDDEDRTLFLSTLGQACERAGLRVHSYVLMGNHYHMLLQTPEPNLSTAMQWLQSTYTIRHNVRHRKRGHLFQGRYKAIPVDPENGTYFRTASDYIHLNPVRAGLLKEDSALLDYQWSSFPALAGPPGKRPAWLCGEWVLNQGDTSRGRRQYRIAMEERAEGERNVKATDETLLKKLRRGWYFGSEEFRENLLGRFKKKCKVGGVRLHDELEAEKIARKGLELFGVAETDLKKGLKGSVEKIAIASVIKKRTVMPNGWIAEKLQMGDPSRVSRYCSQASSRKDVRKLANKLEMSMRKA